MFVHIVQCVICFFFVLDVLWCDKSDEISFQVVQKFLGSSEGEKKSLLRMKFQRDSSAILSTYDIIQELTTTLSKMDKLQNEAYFAHLERILGIETKKWNSLVAERRTNEAVFGQLFASLYGTCTIHSENMWFVWDSSNAQPVCVGCNWEELKRLREDHRQATYLWIRSPSCTFQNYVEHFVEINVLFFNKFENTFPFSYWNNHRFFKNCFQTSLVID